MQAGAARARAPEGPVGDRVLPLLGHVEGAVGGRPLVVGQAVEELVSLKGEGQLLVGLHFLVREHGRVEKGRG